MKNQPSAIRRFLNDGISTAGKPYSQPSALSLRFFDKIGRCLAFTATRAWGILLLSFGLVTLLSHFARYYFSLQSDDVLLPLIVGAVCALFSIPLLFSEEPLCLLLQNSPALRYFFFEFLCLRSRRRTPGGHTLNSAVTAPLGVALAAVGYFTSPGLVLGILGGLILLFLSMESPEAPFFLSLLALPYLPWLPYPNLILGIPVALSLLSFARKVWLGNRIFTAGLTGCLWCLLSFTILISGVFNSGWNSFWSSLLVAAMMLGCVLSQNLVINRRLTDAALGAITVSALPVSVVGIVQYVYGTLTGAGETTDFSWQIGVRATGSFADPDAFAVFLLAAAFCALALAMEKHSARKKFFFYTVFLLAAVALVLTWSRAAWAAFGFGLFGCLALRKFRNPGWWLLPFCLLPCLFCLLPAAWQEPVLGAVGLTDAEVMGCLEEGRRSLLVWRDHLFLGVGIGKDAFAEAYAPYADGGIIPPHAPSLWLHVGCEAGIVALLLFAAVLLSRVVRISRRAKLLAVSTVKLPALFMQAAIFSLLFLGFSNCIFAWDGMLYLFSVLFGLGGATLRISDSEQRDRQYGCDEDYGQDAAVADIRVQNM